MMSGAREGLRGRPVSSNLRAWRRPALVGVTGVIGLALLAGWPARATDPSSLQLAAIGAAFAATAVWIRSGQRGLAVERLGPWLLLLVVTAAISATGDLDSPYVPLVLLVVVYGATFWPTRRYVPLLVGVALATAGLVVRAGAPFQWAEGLPAALSWASAATFVHALVNRLNNAAQTDGLTGLWNHAAFWRRLQSEDARARRHATSYSVLMIDVDHFKLLNDQYGHQAGDAVLRRMADILAKRVRGSDVLARYGGEEFAVLLPDTPQGPAAEVAEKLRRLLAVAGISVSIGVADNAVVTASADEVVGAADAALYDAKLSGRARVCAAPIGAVVHLPATSAG